MMQVKDLTDQDKSDITDKARKFYKRYESHVDSIRKAKGELAIPPSGSDLFKPELWKGIHWNWFFKEFTISN